MSELLIWIYLASNICEAHYWDQPEPECIAEQVNSIRLAVMNSRERSAGEGE